MKGHVAKDHVHLMVSIPPQVTISRLMQWLKGKTAHHLLVEFAHLKKQFWEGICGHADTSAAVRETSPTK
jgi:putative transposase